MAACPPTKDRDSANVLSAGAAISAGVSSHHSLKARNKPLAPKSDSLPCNKRLQNKETEAKLGNLQVAELQALLDEAFQYRGNRDGEQQTELFQALLRETQESGGESPPAFRPTPNQPAQHRRRRSRKESSCLLSNIAAVSSSVHNSTVASSNRKGGSLQNISHTATQSSSHQGARNRKRHDTSDSWGTTLGSPRKREGGSLPSDVTRGSKKPEAESQISSQSVLVMGVGQTDHSPQSSKDVIIDMDGVQDITLTSLPVKSVPIEDQDRFTQPWRLASKSSINNRNIQDPTEEDSGTKSSANCRTSSESTVMTDAEASTTKKLLATTKRQTDSTSGGTYGSLSYKATGAPQEVDDSIPFSSLNRTVVNGTALDEGPTRRNLRLNGPGSDSVMDENGNPFSMRNGPSGGQASTTAQQPMRTSPQSSTMTNTTANKSSRSKKKGKDVDGVLSDQMPGFLGDRDVNELLEYIESSDVGGKRGVVTGNGDPWNKKNNGTRSNNNGSHVSNKDASKIKTKKASKVTRTSGTAVRNDESADESDAATDQQISPDGLEDFVFPARSRSVAAPKKLDLIPAVDSAAVDELEATLAAAADFQTVTKKQRRKKRNNSIGTSNSGSAAAASGVANGRKEFAELLLYNTTAASPSRHQTRRPTGAGSVVSGPSGEMKKLVASVPPSEPSDVDSDGGDSVHSLPVQPSAPLFPSLPAPALMVPILIPAPPAPSSAVSYADIIRSEHGKSDVSFIAESSQPVDIKNATPLPCSASSCSPAVVAPVAAPPAAAAPAADNVPSQRATAHACAAARSKGPSGSRMPLRRAASLPPTSPSVDTPPVVICGASSTTEVDVTFGFELNEQLLALSSSSAASSPTSAPLPPPAVDQLQPPAPSPPAKEPEDLPPVEDLKLTAPVPTARPDFAARYRERPDLASPQVSQRTIEIVDFISQAWSRIQKKLEEQQQHQQRQEINSVGLSSQTSIRVYYTLE